DIVKSGPGSIPKYVGLLEVAGKPAIVFDPAPAGSENRLSYTRADDAEGTSWGEPLDLGMGDAAKHGAGFAIVEGRPAAVMNNRYLRANDPEGTSWPEPTVILDGEPYFYHLLIANGRPAVCNSATFLPAADATGAAWGEPVDTNGPYADKTDGGESFMIVGGRPALAYNAFSNLFYVSAIDEGGTQWRIPTVADFIGDTGYDPELIEAAGRPAIAYHDRTFRVLRYVRALGADGAEWDKPLILDVNTREGQSAAVIDGRPAVAYTERGTLDLWFIVANDDAGTSWGFPVLVDDARIVSGPNDLSLTTVGGQPALVYIVILEEGPQSDLRYAVYR
ncbi:hypothetical protein IIA79_02155, partial [bacterium]|nr:hypothetical protein [bacterium]